jgi:serine/threonine protein kinase
MPTIAHTFFVRPDARLQQDTRLHLAERRFEDTLIVSRTLVRPGAPLSQNDGAPIRAAASAAEAVTQTLSSNAPTMISAARLRSRSDTTVPINRPASSEHECVPLSKGHAVHKYEIEKLIGTGGFGLTYGARDLTINRAVALKELYLRDHCLRSEANEVLAREPARDERILKWARYFFSEEARITFSMRHQSIVRIYEFFKLNNTAYIAYEMLDGCDLEAWCQQQRHNLNDGDAVELFRMVCSALNHVHQRGFLHRDIKPANIFVDKGTNEPVLIDFGAASEIGAPPGDFPAVVSPGFSPVEQYEEGLRQDERSDIYALCATMYWAISGCKPPVATERRTKDQLVSPRAVVDPPFRFSERLYKVLETGLSVEPKDRYAGVPELLADLFPKFSVPPTGYMSAPRGDKIFLSYRRDDSAHFVGRLLDFFEMRFGSGSVFLDVGSIPMGMDFWDHIKTLLDRCAVMLVVIGPRWQKLLRQRRSRWHRRNRGDDYVAMEIAVAIEMQLPIIPVLFDGATMPSAALLPENMRQLANVNAAIIGQGIAFRAGADGIADQIAKLRGTHYSKA